MDEDARPPTPVQQAAAAVTELDLAATTSVGTDLGQAQTAA
jgi:hypothetical protein